MTHFPFATLTTHLPQSIRNLIANRLSGMQRNGGTPSRLLRELNEQLDYHMGKLAQ